MELIASCLTWFQRIGSEKVVLEASSHEFTARLVPMETKHASDV